MSMKLQMISADLRFWQALPQNKLLQSIAKRLAATLNSAPCRQKVLAHRRLKTI
jgi:hypothetical protein